VTDKKQSAEPIPQLDLKAQFRSIRAEVMAAVEKVFDSQAFVLGPQVTELEKQTAQYLGAAHAIGVSNGSDALVVALKSLGVGHGDGVLCPSYTFFATAGAICRLGATPIFLDSEDDTLNLSTSRLAEYLEQDTELREINGKQVVHDRKRGLTVKAVVPVHLFGAAVLMDRVTRLCEDRGLPVVEDTAQALGASYKGKKTGTLGTLGTYSFFPSKNLGGAGDGGLVTTDDENLANRVRRLRVHGAEHRYYHNEVGFNFRLDTLQAAVLLVKLPHLDAWNVSRRKKAAVYTRLLNERRLSQGKGGPVRLPVEHPEAPSIYHQYSVRVPVEDRPRLIQYLADRSIGSAVYYPVPLHLQECFAALGYKPGALPVSEKAAMESLALPIYPELTDLQQERVIDAIDSYFKSGSLRHTPQTSSK